MNKKVLLLIAKIVLHLAGWPLLFVLVYLANRNVIAGGSMYGLPVYVSLIVTAAFALIYYLAYFLVRTRKKRSVRNQHIIVAIVAVCTLTGFWVLVDLFIPDTLADATSSTVFWEDLSDNWEARATVQEGLLRDYVTINYHMGRLTAPNGESLEDYIHQGPNNNAELKALLEADFKSIDGNGYASFKGPSVDYAQSGRMTIPVLLHLFLDDRSAVQNFNSNYKADLEAAGETELKIKVPTYDYYVYEDGAFKVKNENVRVYQCENVSYNFVITDQDFEVVEDGELDYANIVCIQDGKWQAIRKQRNTSGVMVTTATACDSKEAAINYLYTEYGADDYFYGYYHESCVNWHVLDMLGTAMEMQVLDKSLLDFDIDSLLSGVTIAGSPLELGIGTLSDLLETEIVPNTLTLVADMLNEDEVLGSPIYISIDTQTGMLTLNPSNSHRGVLGYMETAWLYNQGLLYIIVSLFSTRTLFYIYGPVMGIIAYLLGILREAEKKMQGDGEEGSKKKAKKEKPAKAKKKKGDAAAAPTEDTAPAAEDATTDELPPAPAVADVGSIDV